MKLIIDIDKDYFEILKYEGRNGNDFKPIKLIANGIPLEELEKIKEEIGMYELDCRFAGGSKECEMCNNNVFGSIYRIIDKHIK